MSQFNHQQQTAAAAAAAADYPPQPSSYPPLGQAEGSPYAAAPPPVGYPTMDRPGSAQHQQVPLETQSRGDKGFWEGCCAALCCCCLLESCF